MAFLHIHSWECAKSELELFSLPTTQSAIEGSQWVYYKPISSLTDNSPIEFAVQEQGDEYIDLAHTMLSVRVTIKLNSPTTAAAAAAAVAATTTPPKVGSVNKLLHSMFNQVDVLFNQKPVSIPNNLYAYRAHIATLLNYDYDAKESHLTTVGCAEDTPGKFDDAADANEGLKKH
ncbi:uncharacterized protein F54H12.2-like [Microplitis demolitor]|uniref:uncharacterized protein F54H12.2-like n=1 Tax=Microplitis demolitor TaxID=69319 RepID=UPI0006D50DD9|nr:uncharacterized protein F54H12.2-like [Microplitis demolitor]